MIRGAILASRGPQGRRVTRAGFREQKEEGMQSERLRFEDAVPKFAFDEDRHPPARIKVVGVGGA